ncbi:NifB/NifX family molybdenum-iron cluster-binding protein [Gemmatimonadota bacterium]
MKIAIPRSGEDVAPCVGHCALMTIYTITGNHVSNQVDFPLQSQEPLDRVRLLRDQGVDTVICGGVQDVLEECLLGSGIEVISWVTGRVDSLLELYLRGQLIPGHEDTLPPGPDLPSHSSR